MQQTIIVAIISAGLGALVNCIFQIINKAVDNDKEKKVYERTKKDQYEEKKKEAYIAVIKRLLEIKIGFDYRRDDLVRSKKLKEEVGEANNKFMDLAPLIRLYSTDEIYNMYCNLAQWSRYSYSDNERLFENSKEHYNIGITILARRMQDDLGYRKYSSDQSTKIQCPSCGNDRDAFSDCPKCGMTYSQLIDVINKTRVHMEEQMKAENDTEMSCEDDNKI